MMKAIYRYCEAHSSLPHRALAELERETHLKTIAPQMMSGQLQGQLMRMLVRLLQPRRILEIGTFTGYGAICLASGLGPEGRLITLEINEEYKRFWDKYFPLAGLQDRIEVRIGDAFDLIPTLPGPFDLVYLDSNKVDYPALFDLVFDRVAPGGLILADNVLWGGKVVNPNPDADTRVLDAFNQKIASDGRVEQLILPLRDGLMLIQKR